ncbi:unnamed protein product [Lactuca saligna]|uniref:Uncharacterized protein n=1 Tax=Lactuca saligna TaxID=75948 RepID=A0AA36DV94_LACSI|nr:unnamed protein product [Lactuca saligna]
METVNDLDTIDVELDEFFKKKQRSRCEDELLNTLTKEALDECTIPEINLHDFKEILEAEAQQEELSDGHNKDKLQFQYLIHDPKVKWNNMKLVYGERYNVKKIREVNLAAYDHLVEMEPKSLCKAFFKGGMACEVNGVCPGPIKKTDEYSIDIKVVEEVEEVKEDGLIEVVEELVEEGLISPKHNLKNLMLCFNNPNKFQRMCLLRVNMYLCQSQMALMKHRIKMLMKMDLMMHRRTMMKMELMELMKHRRRRMMKMELILLKLGLEL